MKPSTNYKTSKAVVSNMMAGEETIAYSRTQKKIPKGYMTAEEFRKRAIEKVNKFCDTHGIV